MKTSGGGIIPSLEDVDRILVLKALEISQMHLLLEIFVKGIPSVIFNDP
ncbi:hypothetical protein V6582_08270 [Agrobacterium vitis]|nr:hypothetical protein [Agrobacterium vitis]MVA26146.1 hypothetical protein [Agrobacterium vitis]